MRILSVVVITVSLVLSAAIFGFFYAWVCSTMWGLDAADPRIAIAAMQAMNASVRNAVFAPAFFGTPIALGLTAALLLAQKHRLSAAAFALAAALYAGFCLMVTLGVNVPMNEALATVAIPQDVASAKTIWQDYSQPWQFWNQLRTIASGLAFLAALSGLFLYKDASRAASTAA
ncbi:anthrone oxygenase family protein [uncultured Devosia sp.]|uniref:anthrone oxygenase family protein n=1 Tax=uncultured Devosia sp. TaxID=211434 RepID=UPI00261B0094|nr:anthrone oxygenase family protein [uncultured Devosia sp.]